MGHEEDLSRLENIVEKMLAGFNELKRKNSALEASLALKEEEVQGLKETLNDLQDDRSAIRERVTGLISSIEKWEKSQESEEAKGTEDEGENAPALSSRGLFSAAG